MTPSEPVDRHIDDESRSMLWPALRAIVFGMLAVMSLGVLFGFLVSMAEHGWKHSATAYLALLGIILVLAGSGWLAVRALAALRPGPASPRTTRARRMIYASMILGGVVGVLLQIGAVDSSRLIEGSLSPVAAIVAIAGLLVGVTIISWIWWRNIDEHEALSYKDGALAGMYAHSAITMTWWFGWRGGFFTEPHAMIILLIVTAVWGLVWAWRRYA